MDRGLLGVAGTLGCLVLISATVLGSGPQGAVSPSGTVRPTRAPRVPHGPRSQTGRRTGIIAATPYPLDAPEDDSRAGEATLPPTLPTLSAEPSSIQPLPPSTAPQPPQSLPVGYLWLAVEPRTAQVYIDGFYIGTVEDAHRAQTGLRLAVGWHRMELRAPGFETPAVNVTIEPNRTTSYQAALKPTRP